MTEEVTSNGKQHPPPRSGGLAEALDGPDPQEPDGGSASSPNSRRWWEEGGIVHKFVWLFYPLAVLFLLTMPFLGLCSARDWMFWFAGAFVVPAYALANRWVVACLADASSWRVRLRDRRLVIPGSLGAVAILFAAGALMTPNTDPDVRSRQVGVAPHGLASAGDQLWIADPNTDSVFRLDSAESLAVDQFEIPGAFELSRSDGDLWVSSVEPNRLTLIDLEGTTIESIALPDQPGDVDSTSTTAWIAFPRSGQVGAVDRKTLTLELFDAGVSPSSLVADDDAIWVTDTGSSSVLRIDPATGSLVSQVDVVGEPIGIVQDGTQIWVTTTGDSRIVAIDTADNSTTQFRPRTSADPTDVLAFDGVLWVVSSDLGQVLAFDPNSQAALKVFDLGGHPIKIESHGAYIAVSDSVSGTVHLIPTSGVRQHCWPFELKLQWPA